MPVNIKYTSDVKTNGIKMVVFGGPKVGKTVLCSTAPKPIIISAEQGLLSLANKNIPYIEVHTLKEIQEVYIFLKDNNDFDTICLDSISEITEVVYDYSRREVENEATESGKTDLRKAFMLLANRMMPMIKKFRDIKGKNIVFTAKQKRYEDEYTGKQTLEPMLPGQVVSANLPYVVDLVLHLEVDIKSQRFLQCHPKSGLLIGDRSGILSAKEKPDLTYIFNKIVNSEKIINIQKGDK